MDSNRPGSDSNRDAGHSGPPGALSSLDSVDPFGGLPDVAPEADLVPVTEVMPVKVLSREDEVERRLKSIEQDIFRASCDVVRDTLRARDVEADATAAPLEWVTEEGLSPEEARKRLRVATAAHLSQKDSPSYIHLAQKTFASVVRARATEKAAPKSLNINFVQMSGALPEYPVKKVD